MDQDTFYSKEIILENERVQLVPFSTAVEDDLMQIIFDDELSFSVNCENDEDVRNYVEQTVEQRALKLAYPFIIIDKSTGEVAGSTRLGLIQFGNKRLEIGWTWFGRKFRGTGLNLACKYELLRYAFETMKFRRVQLSADVDNIRSQKAIIKLGAVKEGVFRSNYINHLGESRDDIYFSITHKDWPVVKKSVFERM
jgi:RimJ/RimL family protein N-acetyltransferase